MNSKINFKSKNILNLENLWNIFLKKVLNISSKIQSKVEKILEKKDQIIAENKQKEIDRQYYQNVYGYTNSKWEDFAVFTNPITDEIEYIFWVNKKNHIPNDFQIDAIKLKWKFREKYKDDFKKVKKTPKQIKVIKYALEFRKKLIRWEEKTPLNKSSKKLDLVWKNPSFNWKFEYKNTKWEIFRFVAKNWLIEKIISKNQENVKPQQKAAIQKFINQNNISKFKNLVQKKSIIQEKSNKNNSLIEEQDKQENAKNPNINNIINESKSKVEDNLLEVMQIKRKKELEMIFELLKYDLAEIMKYDFWKKFSLKQKKSAFKIIAELSKKIEISNTSSWNNFWKTAHILVNNISNYLKYWKYDTDESQKYLSMINSWFISAKRIFLLVNDKHSQEEINFNDVVYTY